MKNSSKIFSTAFVILLSGFITPSFAQNTASATITACVITPISIAKIADMNFGNIVIDNANSGTMIMTPGGTPAATGGLTIPASNSTVTAASFLVTGQANSNYLITLPFGAQTLSNGSHTMTVTSFTSTPSISGSLTEGYQIIRVGATLQVKASQAPGTYVSATPFEVIVNND